MTTQNNTHTTTWPSWSHHPRSDHPFSWCGQEGLRDWWSILQRSGHTKEGAITLDPKVRQNKRRDTDLASYLAASKRYWSILKSNHVGTLCTERLKRRNRNPPWTPVSKIRSPTYLELKLEELRDTASNPSLVSDFQSTPRIPKALTRQEGNLPKVRSQPQSFNKEDPGRAERRFLKRRIPTVQRRPWEKREREKSRVGLNHKRDREILKNRGKGLMKRKIDTQGQRKLWAHIIQ